jgi:hypothetical protein
MYGFGVHRVNICIANILAWFPTRVMMPTISSTDLLLAAAKDLITALQNPSPGSPFLAPTPDSQMAALKQLADTFHDCTKRSPLLDATPTGHPSLAPLTHSPMTSPEVRQDSTATAPRVHPSIEPPTPETVPPVPPGFYPSHRLQHYPMCHCHALPDRSNVL